MSLLADGPNYYQYLGDLFSICLALASARWMTACHLNAQSVLSGPHSLFVYADVSNSSRSHNMAQKPQSIRRRPSRLLTTRQGQSSTDDIWSSGFLCSSFTQCSRCQYTCEMHKARSSVEHASAHAIPMPRSQRTRRRSERSHRMRRVYTKCRCEILWRRKRRRNVCFQRAHDSLYN